MLTSFGQDLYLADGPTVSFFGFPYPTRMALARLSSGKVWIWSPIALSEQLASEVARIGPVGYIVSPNKLHHLFLSAWTTRWPEARVYAPPGLARRMPRLRFTAPLLDRPEEPWLMDLDQLVFRGSIALEEVVFFHRPSRTVIIADLIQRFPESMAGGWKGAVMRLSGLVGPRGSTPWDWRMSFLNRAQARSCLQRVLAWKPERLVIAHGACADAGAVEIVKAALSWI